MKKMKKFAVVALALMLMATQLVLASAEGLGNRTQDVKAKYSGGAAEPEVYSVDVTWGKMEFTYSVGGTRTWNPATHLYDENATAGWTEDGNGITVVNHSNAEVNFAFTAQAAAGFEAIALNFDTSRAMLASAVNTTYAAAPAHTITVTPSGALTEDTTAGTVIGTITVTLS